MAKKENGVLNKFQQLFNVKYKADSNSNKQKNYNDKYNKVRPARVEYDKNGKPKLKVEKLPPQAEEMFKYYMEACHTDKDTFERINDVFEDMDMLYMNSPIMTRSMDLLADEVVQADANVNALGVDAPKASTRKYVEGVIEKLDLNKKLRSLALDIVKYGNAGWVLSLDDEGVDDITQVDPYAMTNRFEFTPHEVKKEIHNSSSAIYKMQSMNRMDQLIQAVSESEDVASYFRSYLFGFQIGDFLLPPWRFLHFRNYTSQTPFKPYGIPFFIHAVAPYRQYDAMRALRIAAQGANFPKEIFELTAPNSMSPTDKLEMLAEFKQSYENSGFVEPRKEGAGVGDVIFTIADLWTHETQSPDIDIRSFEDEEMRDDLIIASQMPRNFLDPNNGSFGNSGVSLVQQFKPFARKVFHIQSIILEQIDLLIKIDAIQSGKFEDLSELDYQLTLPYPESQADRDLVSSQSDLLRLANDIIGGFGEKITGERDPVMPIDFIRQVYTQILPYDSERVESWINTIQKERQSDEMKESADRIQKILENKEFKEKHFNIKEEVWQARQEKLTNSVYGARHVYSSNNNTNDMMLKSLTKDSVDERKSFLKEQAEKMKEKNQTYKEYAEESGIEFSNDDIAMLVAEEVMFSQSQTEESSDS